MLLLSLLLPSYIVALIRELANITLSITAMANISNNMIPIQDIDIVVDLFNNLFDIDNKFDEVRGCLLVLSIHRPRTLLISLSEYSEEYHICIKKESNRIDKDEPVISVGSIQIKYTS